MTTRRPFGSTYRLQLNGLGFAGATETVPFLSDLGVQTCYLSPVTRARTGSGHGYDVIDPTSLDPALGTRVEYDALLSALADHGMTVLIDIVPNHMAASTQNRFFADVLRHGQGSQFASYFDIDWSEQGGRILLPVLGQPLDAALAAGELAVIREDATGEVAIGYFEHRFPVDPASVNGDPTAVPIEALLDRQHYRLADWRVANRELNYRRFFDINELIAVRQEDPEVFAATHRLILDLVSDPRVAGVRVDHVDGLRDPAGYLAALRMAVTDAGAAPVIEVEKILERDERLPDWPVDGTTGYEFAVAVTGLFVDPSGADRLAAATAAATGDDRSFTDRARAAKRQVIETLFTHQLDTVVVALSTLTGLDAAAAIAELTAQLSVYRLYRQPGAPITAADQRWIAEAAARARVTLSPDDVAALDAVVGVLSADLDADSRAANAVAAWQQLTSPATAKGVEDTALYTPGRLLATADVGGDPDRGAVGVVEFHAAMHDRQRRTPLAMSTLSTHDSKRSHDVRCRLAVLSEVPELWESAVRELDAAGPSQSSEAAPDAGERRYLYETLVGIWPVDGDVSDELVERVETHVVKAAREAKRHTSWTDPDPDYEAGLTRFAVELLTDTDGTRRGRIGEMAASIARSGVMNSLASVVIRAAAPGVPDVYQGDDEWFFALVDPDNRRRFDAAGHSSRLAELPAPTAKGLYFDQLLNTWYDGRIKQLFVRQSLRFRRRNAAWLDDASYQPLVVTGRHHDKLLAFARSAAERTVLCVVPIRPYALAAGEFPLADDCWADTRIESPADASTEYVDAITGRRISVDGHDHHAEDLFYAAPFVLWESTTR